MKKGTVKARVTALIEIDLLRPWEDTEKCETVFRIAERDAVDWLRPLAVRKGDFEMRVIRISKVEAIILPVED